MIIFFTGISRTASEIAGEQIKNIPKIKKDLEEMYHLVDSAMQICITQHADLMEFGDLLHETWMLKKKLSTRISNKKIDEIYDTARSEGAIGGKLLGAGGGGFILFFAQPENHAKIISSRRREGYSKSCK